MCLGCDNNEIKSLMTMIRDFFFVARLLFNSFSSHLIDSSLLRCYTIKYNIIKIIIFVVCLKFKTNGRFYRSQFEIIPSSIVSTYVVRHMYVRYSYIPTGKGQFVAILRVCMICTNHEDGKIIFYIHDEDE